MIRSPTIGSLVLIGQPPLLQSLSLCVNEEIRSRITYSALLPRLAPETIEAFILGERDRAGLGHNTFSPEALALIVRSGEGLLRRTRNLCLGSLIEAVRDQIRLVDLKQVNRVLIQPHWRRNCDAPLPETRRFSPRRGSGGRVGPPGRPITLCPRNTDLIAESRRGGPFKGPGQKKRARLTRK